MGPDGVAPWQMMRSFRRDPSVVGKKLAPGTGKRIVQFAAPYRNELPGFLPGTLLSSFAAVLNPLIFKKIIDDGIGTNPPESGRPGLVVALALLVAGLAVFGA